MPLLETVSEENRRHLDNHDLSDYYFRDSFEHSSSESGFTGGLNDGTNRLLNHTSEHHHHHLASTASATHPHGLISNNANIVNQQNASNNAKNAKQFSLVSAFVPSFLFVIVIVIISTIIILESDAELFVSFKNLPEIISLKYQYYQPLRKLITGIFSDVE